MDTLKAAWVLLALSVLSTVVSSMSGCSRSAEADDDVMHARILDQLSSIADQLEALRAQVADQASTRDAACGLDAFLAGQCDDNPAETTVTFCFSQGAGAELGLAYAVEGKKEAEVGVGWGDGPKVGIDIGLSWPAVARVPVPGTLGLAWIPGPPLPTSVSASAAGEIGRSFDTCVDIPVRLDAPGEERLAQLTRDINGEYRDKFQFRADRVLDFGERKKSDEKMERADAAVERLMETGLADTDTAFGLFEDPSITELVDTLDLPVKVKEVLSDPQGILNHLSATDAGTVPNCAELGIDDALRNRFENVERLCTRLEGLPTGTVTERMAGRVDTVFNRIEGSVPTRANMRRFCDYVSLRVGSESDCVDAFQ